MELLQERIKALRAIENDMPVLIGEVIEDNNTLIEDMVISQMQKGQRGDGSFLRDYSPVSVFGYGKPPGPIKLFETGAFYRATTLKVFGQAFGIANTDPKRQKLVGEFGPGIQELSSEHLQQIADEILEPGLIEKTYDYFK